ncbi:MAG: phosphatidylglycerophosphatase A [Gammaproteobacteria bacterium]
MKRNHLPAGFWKNPAHFLACGLGAGAAPYAPGTFGTVVGVLLFLVLAPWSLPLYALATLLLFAVGVWLCGVTARDFGVHDHSGIVWDEIVGYLVTMFAAPAGLQWLVTGFILFRLFDVLKPWPIAWVDRRVGGGFGIMVDDLLAGVFSWVCLQALYRLV